MAGLTFHDCCKAIIRNKDQKSLNYAVNYARAGLLMEERGNMARVQTIYLLDNITYWRGDEAKAVRAKLKEIRDTK